MKNPDTDRPEEAKTAEQPTPMEFFRVARGHLKSGRQKEAYGVLIQAVLHYPDEPVLLSFYGSLQAAVDKTVPVEEISGTEWDRIIGINLSGPFLLSKYALPAMKKQKHGHIVNIVSTASKRAWPNAAAYHASKWGLLGLSHALHTEARPHGVKVTALVAGGMRTPFLLDRFSDIDQSTLQDPRNVAETIRFLLSQPAETVIPEVMVIPMRETSWP